jgi:ABC-type proline/glycine betaine transport system permease subunit
MRTLGATKVDTLLNVGLPRTMPYFFASLKVAVTLAFVGAVISETGSAKICQIYTGQCHNMPNAVPKYAKRATNRSMT